MSQVSGSPGDFAAYRLPPGRHRLSPEQVAENQRWRLLGAAAEVLAERGYARVTSAQVARCAGVSSSVFYKYFDDLAGCVLAAYETAADCVSTVVTEACKSRVEPEERLWAAVDAVLSFCVEEPALMRLLGPEPAAGVERIAATRAELIDRLARMLAAVHGEAAPETAPSAERHLVAATFTLVSDRLIAGEAESLPALAPELTELLSGLAV